MVLGQRRCSLLTEPCEYLPAQFGDHLHRKVVRQLHNVILPVPERGQAHHIEGQAIQQIPAKVPGVSHFGQIGVGGRHDPHINLDGFGAPNPLEFTVFDQAQQFFLQAQGHGAQFVEEQRAAVRPFKSPDMLFGRAGEGSCLVSKQLTLQQGLGNGATVYFYEDFRPACGQEMQTFCRQFLAGTPLPQD